MVDENNKGIDLREINVREIIYKLWKGRKYYFISLPIALVVSAFVILSIPRYYDCEVKLAPETSMPNTGGLGSLASSLGLNMGNLASQDAIVPELYPDLMSSVDFQVSMFPVKVVTKDGKIATTYYDYLKTKQQCPWWTRFFASITSKFKAKEKKVVDYGLNVNPFKMTKKQNDIALLINNKILCSVDKKTDVISIVVRDQDPLIAATIADTVKTRLQQFIIDYRTKKARNDVEYARKLSIEAKAAYIKAQEKYAAYSDANEDVILESFKAKRDEYENEMQLRYNTYQQTMQQLQLSRAKLQERIPAFTTLQTASVPIKPAGPKRMIFVAFCLFLTFVATSVFVYKKF